MSDIPVNPQDTPRPAALAALKPYIRILFLLILGALAFVEFRTTGRVRRTFVFYTTRERTAVVEERMFPRITGIDGGAGVVNFAGFISALSGAGVDHTGAEERDIRRYVEETLLGPITPELAPLFPQGTRLYALMYRSGIVYANLSESAALPSEAVTVSSMTTRLPEGEVFQSIRTLSEGIQRNFLFVRKVKIFIEGHEVS